MNLPDFFHSREISVSYSGEKPWKVRHEIYEAATLESIDYAQDEIGIEIPEIIREFWQRSDGAFLYKNVLGEPWGWKIIGAQQYLENQHRWRRRYFDYWDVRYLLVAELMNPRQAIVWNGELVLVLEDEIGIPRETEIARSMEDFFLSLYESKGGLWWKWGADF